MGAVYEGVHTETGERFAIKVLSPALAAVPAARARFLKEAKLTARVRHPHIVEVTDVGEDAGQSYFVMEMLEGEDLSSRLAAAPGRCPPRETVDIMLPVCDARGGGPPRGITHRDLKPSNIFLTIRDRAAASHRPRLRNREGRGGGEHRGTRPARLPPAAGVRNAVLPCPRAGRRSPGGRSCERSARPGRHPLRVPDGPAALPRGQRREAVPGHRRGESDPAQHAPSPTCPRAWTRSSCARSPWIRSGASLRWRSWGARCGRSRRRPPAPTPAVVPAQAVVAGDRGRGLDAQPVRADADPRGGGAERGVVRRRGGAASELGRARRCLPPDGAPTRSHRWAEHRLRRGEAGGFQADLDRRRGGRRGRRASCWCSWRRAGARPRALRGDDSGAAGGGAGAGRAGSGEAVHAEPAPAGAGGRRTAGGADAGSGRGSARGGAERAAGAGAERAACAGSERAAPRSAPSAPCGSGAPTAPAGAGDESARAGSRRRAPCPPRAGCPVRASRRTGRGRAPATEFGCTTAFRSWIEGDDDGVDRSAQEILVRRGGGARSGLGSRGGAGARGHGRRTGGGAHPRGGEAARPRQPRRGRCRCSRRPIRSRGRRGRPRSSGCASWSSATTSRRSAI